MFTQGTAQFFQVLSRNNDVNGNPYRLVLLYDDMGHVVKVYEARSSRPNIIGKLNRELFELVPLHLAPSEYNSVKRTWAKVLERAD
jgi:hypothetical protein